MVFEGDSLKGYMLEYKDGKLVKVELPNVEERKVGKCTDCEEYNQEKHYCPKFCDVIRETTKEMQEFYKGEHEKLERIEHIVERFKSQYDHTSNLDLMVEIKEVLEQE